MDINKRIIDLCNERGWSIYELSLQSGITQSSLNSMIQRKSPPKIENLKCICEAFGLTLAQFFVEDEEIEALSINEKKLVASFRRLPLQKQKALLELIEG